MARVVIIGLPGDDQLYVADIDAGTVQPMQPPASGPLASANDLRNVGGTIVKDVNLAVAVSSSEQAFSGVFDG
ncbi:hypothetical protein J2046_001743 [Rhizobium petrolearium]|uniref:hypothetical protein n=1 Tax=Neorhizobium petrolearium TaxID=515361 RepID=UPI001AE3BA41|nr:hypothetical protein [Neorhizobium petrolearium]MBP1843487.1 hypothetical protein [Neorhizobium petrolearium]